MTGARRHRGDSYCFPVDRTDSAASTTRHGPPPRSRALRSWLAALWVNSACGDWIDQLILGDRLRIPQCPGPDFLIRPDLLNWPDLFARTGLMQHCHLLFGDVACRQALEVLGLFLDPNRFVGPERCRLLAARRVAGFVAVQDGEGHREAGNECHCRQKKACYQSRDRPHGVLHPGCLRAKCSDSNPVPSPSSHCEVVAGKFARPRERPILVGDTHVTRPP
jgi:hypothetical protein